MEPILRIIEAPFVLASHLASLKRQKTRIPVAEGMGTDCDTGDPVILTPKDLAKHCYVLGATGCGKTTFILELLEQDLESGHSTVVLDLRGDLIARVLALSTRLKVDPDRITLLDLRERDKVRGFNPLQGAGEPYIRALHLLDVIASESGSWGVQLEETMRSAFLLLASAAEPVTKLETVFFDDAFRGRLLASQMDESLSAFWERFEEMSIERRQTWALPVMNKVTPLLSVPIMRQVLGSSSPLDLAGLLNRRGSILLVSLAVDELHRTSRMLGSLIVAAICREMMARVNVPEGKRNPVRLYIDEFENMASEPFENLIAEGRRFGLTLVLSHQTLSQLAPRLRSVIRNNVWMQLIFQCGFEDAQAIAKELPSGTESEAIRGLEVGQAFLMTRDGEARLVQFRPPREEPPKSDVVALRSAVLDRIPEVPKESHGGRDPACEPEAGPDLEDWL